MQLSCSKRKMRLTLLVVNTRPGYIYSYIFCVLQKTIGSCILSSGQKGTARKKDKLFILGQMILRWNALFLNSSHSINSHFKQDTNCPLFGKYSFVWTALFSCPFLHLVRSNSACKHQSVPAPVGLFCAICGSSHSVSIVSGVLHDAQSLRRSRLALVTLRKFVWFVAVYLSLLGLRVKRCFGSGIMFKSTIIVAFQGIRRQREVKKLKRSFAFSILWFVRIMTKHCVSLRVENIPITLLE